MPYWLCAVVFCYCLCKCEVFLFAYSSGNIALPGFLWKPWKYQSASIFPCKQKRTPGRTSFRKKRQQQEGVVCKKSMFRSPFVFILFCSLMHLLPARHNNNKNQLLSCDGNKERERESILKWHISNTDSVVWQIQEFAWLLLHPRYNNRR